MYMSKWFVSKDEAVKFQKEHGGVLYSNVTNSKTRLDHMVTSYMFGFDAKKYHYSVNWTLPKGKFEI